MVEEKPVTEKQYLDFTSLKHTFSFVFDYNRVNIAVKKTEFSDIFFCRSSYIAHILHICSKNFGEEFYVHTCILVFTSWGWKMKAERQLVHISLVQDTGFTVIPQA